MSATARQALREALESRGPLTLHELSAELHRSERDLLADLAHLDRSLARERARLVIEPSTCLSSGFVFTDRRRFARAGRCPTCKGTRLTYPRFSITGAGRG